MSFSNEQITAIEHINGPAMVLAGPGSGKTTVITHRILNLLRKGIPSEDILVITFTKDAAQEMETRFNKLLNETVSASHDNSFPNRISSDRSSQGSMSYAHTTISETFVSSDRSSQSNIPWNRPSETSPSEPSETLTRIQSGHQITFGTFHSVFFFILRLRYHLSFKNIITDKNKMLILRDLTEQEHIDTSYDKDFFRMLLSEISKYKSMGDNASAFTSKLIDTDKFHRIIKNYQEELKRERLLDFDDMLLLCYELFLKEPEELRVWQEKYRYILVDEFQDISPVQYKIVRMMAEPENNLFIVGDDDQSIYRFRGAEPSIMLGFEHDYPDAKRILLSNNYRSKKEIVTFAKNVINHNKQRFKKDITAAKGPGGSVFYYRAEDPVKEYTQVTKNIIRELKSGTDPNEIAILFRTEMLIQSLASELTRAQIPYVLKNKVKNIYESGIALDIISYIKLSLGKGTRADFLRIMNKPLRYISRKAMDSRDMDFNKLKRYYNGQKSIQKNIEKLRQDLLYIRHLPTVAAIIYIEKKVGYIDHLIDSSRENHINPESASAIIDEIEAAAQNIPDKEKWLGYIDDYSAELAKSQAGTGDGIRLMTFHSSKGLEFDIVHLIDINESIVPYSKAVTREDIEEERRAFYVALTRARNEFHIYFTDRRYSKNCSPSRFIREGLS